MCKLNKKSGLKRIDPCMRQIIKNINIFFYLKETSFVINACCCGHGKYSPTIVVTDYSRGIKTLEGEYYYKTFDFLSGVEIPRKKRFYKKDKDGYYYIPEVVKNNVI
jgi:hypothetical protein